MDSRVKANTARFAAMDSAEEAYWLGFIYTDGCLDGTKLVFNLAGRDVEQLVNFAKFIGSSRRPREWIRKDGRPYATFTITSNVIAGHLRRTGLHEAKTWTIAPWDGPPDLMRHFWRGCIDGDGSIHRAQKIARGVVHHEWRLHFCGNHAMVNGLAEYVKRVLGISKTLGKTHAPRNGNQQYHLRYSERQAARVVEHFYQGDGEPSLLRKKQAAEAFLREHATRKGVRKLRCQTPGCAKPYAAKGFCNSCWRRSYREQGRDKSRASVTTAA